MTREPTLTLLKMKSLSGRETRLHAHVLLASNTKDLFLTQPTSLPRNLVPAPTTSYPAPA